MVHKIITAQEFIKNLNERSASLFLALLLCGDLVFIALHFVNGLTPLDISLLNFERDGGYPEIYQYVKFFWITIILISFSLRIASLHYVSWSLVFAYFLFDDALELHERFGEHIAANLSFVPMLGLRLQDYGELAVSATAGAILIFPLVWAYRSGTRMFQKVSMDISLLILTLIFFGVVVDMAHSAIQFSWKVSFLIGTIEDGGEMLSVSFILWYVFLIGVRDRDSDYYLCDFARIVTNPTA